MDIKRAANRTGKNSSRPEHKHHRYYRHSTSNYQWQFVLYRPPKELASVSLSRMAKMIGSDAEASPACMNERIFSMASYNEFERNERKLLSALQAINPASLSYTEWVQIGMGLKQEGLSCSDWDSWSRADSRYKEGECQKKWNSFTNGEAGKITGGTIIKMAQDAGWQYQDDNGSGSLSWNDTIEDDGYRKNEAVKASQSHENRTSDNLPAEDTKPPKNEDKSVKKDNTPGLYRDKIKKAAADVEKAKKYLHSRGISDRTIERYEIGYYSREYFPRAGKEMEAAIFPYNSQYSYYCARSLDGKYFNKPTEKEAGKEPLFRPSELYGSKACFICEGALDALAIIESGGAATALIGTAWEKLLKQIDSDRPKQPLILFLDHDEKPDKDGVLPGPESQARLVVELKKRQITFIEAQFDYTKYPGNHKDANDLIRSNPPQLREDVQRLTAEAKRQAQLETRPDNVADYIDTMMSKEISEFKADVRTGYANLDKASGGLYAGLYVCAGISSLGKTTFIHQAADYIASTGHDVLFFSLEMSRLEMVTKSIARITAQKDLKTAVTSLNIRKGYLPKNVIEASQEYKDRVGNRMNIIEGNFDSDITFIKNYIEKYINDNGTKPAIILDYLQITQPEDTGKHQSTKEAVDMTVTQLKRLSRQYGLTIIALCSVNRANYLTPIDFESLKESGNIEFTADVIWGLQLHCLSEDLFGEANKVKEKRERVNECKAEEPRQIDLICLKNRFGIANYTCSFNYYAANDLFEPVGDFEPKKPKQKPKKII